MTRIEPESLVDKDKVIQNPKKRKKFISKIVVYLLVIFVIFIISLMVGVISSGENLAKTLGNIGLFDQLQHLVSSDDKVLAGEDEDRINVLLLGMGGIEDGFVHDGPYLTDTIMIASFQPSTNKVAMISIPRDLFVPIPGYGWRKINQANSIGELREAGSGGEFAKEALSEIFDIPIHYYIRIDFAGFKKIIDDLGGITVEVENTLEDYHYPIPGKETATTSERYEHLYVESGEQKMDGKLALKFVRSRQALGTEGSDFARSKRQQKVLMAVKEKVLSFGTLANPYKITKLMDTLSEHFATDVQVWEILRAYKLAKDVSEEDIARHVFEAGPDDLLYPSITAGGAFVLLTKSGNFDKMQMVMENIFNAEPAKIVKTVSPQNIEIQNGTKISGLASKTSQYLKSLDYEVIAIGNAPTQDYKKTVVYSLEPEVSDEAAAKIAKILDCELASSIPTWIKSTSSPRVNAKSDILIILGQDRINL